MHFPSGRCFCNSTTREVDAFSFRTLFLQFHNKRGGRIFLQDVVSAIPQQERWTYFPSGRCFCNSRTREVDAFSSRMSGNLSVMSRDLDWRICSAPCSWRRR
ncbi:hypothetical protein SRHO_G00195630 [Serrasalmus rhombeus]